ncbi:hypothetical protein D3C78_1860170 [compost metagenome]
MAHPLKDFILNALYIKAIRFGIEARQCVEPELVECIGGRRVATPGLFGLTAQAYQALDLRFSQAGIEYLWNGRQQVL